MTSVRLFQPGDLDAVARLFDAYRQFLGQPSELEKGRAYLARRLEAGEVTILVAEAQDHAIAGFTLLYSTYSSVSLGRVFIINDLFIDPPYRRFGLSSALLQAVAAHARSVGAIRLTSRVAVDNIATQLLSEKNGLIRDTRYVAFHMRTGGDSDHIPP